MITKSGRSPMMQRIACLHADVSGYCRLIAADVTSTVRTLTAYRKMMAAAVARHGGVVVDTAGDSLLATFATAGDAVSCAVDIQGEIERRNARLPRDRQLSFRIGIELGDALIEAGAVYGSCVNIAARTQQVATPGSVYVAGAAYEALHGTLPLSFDHLGPSTLRSIDTPQHLYRVR